jgi:hypothetical protein
LISGWGPSEGVLLKEGCQGCYNLSIVLEELAVITEISSAQGGKNSASSTQKNSHSWHKD